MIVITFYSKPSCLYSRLYSQNLPSLHALKDWCDWSDVTWFLGVAVAVARSCLFIPYDRKSITLHLRDDNGKLWVEAIIVTSLDAVATVDVAGIQNTWSQVTGHRSEVQDTALLIYNGDRQFPLKLKVYFRLWLGLTCTCDLHLWAVSCDLRFGPAAVDVLTAINNDVNLDETRPIYFTWLIINHRFVLRE